MIPSHRIALNLLDRKDRDLPRRRRSDTRLERLGKVSRRLEQFISLAGRLTRLGSLDLPLPIRLHQINLPVASGMAGDAGVWEERGAARMSRPQGLAYSSARPRDDLMASVRAPSRAVAAAVSGTHALGSHSATLVANHERFRPARAPLLASVASALPERKSGMPASQARSLVEVAQAAIARPGGGGDGATSGEQGYDPRGLTASAAMRIAGRATRDKKTLSFIASGQTRGDRLTAIDRSNPAAAATLQIMDKAQDRAAHLSVSAGFDLPSGVERLPLDTPQPESTGDAQQRLAVLHHTVVSAPHAATKQDTLRRQVVPPANIAGTPAASFERMMQRSVGDRRIANPAAAMEGGQGVEAGREMIVSLMGDVVIDGRRLGQVAASSQASQASLPAHGPSRVNLRAVPIHSGMQIPQ